MCPKAAPQHDPPTTKYLSLSKTLTWKALSWAQQCNWGKMAVVEIYWRLQEPLLPCHVQATLHNGHNCRLNTKGGEKLLTIKSVE